MAWKITCLLLLGIVELGLGAPTYFNKRQEEAEQIALESMGSYLPLDPVVKRIMKDLKVIREEYPVVRNVVHRKKWIPGEVVVPRISDDQINQIDQSRVFGPLRKVKKLRSSSGPTVLVFSRAYHPERLADKLYEKFKIRAKPNTDVVPDSAYDGSITYNARDGTIVVEKRPRAAYAGFRSKSSWKFNVVNGKVKLLRTTKPGFSFSG